MIPSWGCDPHPSRISIAWRCDVDQGARSVVFGALKGGERLAAIHFQTMELVQAILSEEPRRCPSLCLVEQPFAGGANGRRPDPIMYFSVGVIMAALSQALGLWTDSPVVEPVNVTSWKLEALGRGHGFDRPQDYLRGARELGYEGESEDEAAAYLIAICAEKRCRLAGGKMAA